MSKFQNENNTLFKLKIILELFETTSRIVEFTQRANPTELKGVHGEADQVNLTYEEEVLLRVRDYLLFELVCLTER